MKDYKDGSWLNDNVWGRWGDDDELGALNEVGPAEVLKAISYIKKGKIYDLETERFKGMPLWSGHCQFELLTYASPLGKRNLNRSKYSPEFAWHKEGGWLDDSVNEFQTDANTDMMIAPMHMGTHIDGFCHITTGEDAHWYNGYNVKEHWSDYGPLKADATTIPPIMLRGVLLDIAGYKGLDHVPANYGITIEDIEGCAQWAGVELQKNDCVLLRCGETWPEADKCPGAGMTIAAARYLVEEKGAVLLGNDMLAFEMNHADGSMSWPGHCHPVHHYLLTQQGVHFMEAVQMNELANDKVYEFCLIVSSCKIRGATGMFIRPLAVV